MTPASDTRYYALRISSSLDADFLASYCPPGATMTIHDKYIILSDLRTDQAGILGIIRQLHNFGCVLYGLETKIDDFQQH